MQARPGPQKSTAGPPTSRVGSRAPHRPGPGVSLLVLRGVCSEALSRPPRCVEARARVCASHTVWSPDSCCSLAVRLAPGAAEDAHSGPLCGGHCRRVPLETPTGPVPPLCPVTGRRSPRQGAGGVQQQPPSWPHIATLESFTTPVSGSPARLGHSHFRSPGVAGRGGRRERCDGRGVFCCITSPVPLVSVSRSQPTCSSLTPRLHRLSSGCCVHVCVCACVCARV